MPEFCIEESALPATYVESETPVPVSAPTSPPWAATSSSISSPGSKPGCAANSEILQISLHDRLAFASRFLPDDALRCFVFKIRQECLDAGRVDGLLITGPSLSGGRLLQRYLDTTGDVQTAAITGCYLLRAAQVTTLLRSSFALLVIVSMPADLCLLSAAFFS
jgi:hypothetical protein